VAPHYGAGGIGLAGAGIPEGAATDGAGVVITVLALHDGAELAATGSIAFGARFLVASQTVGQAIQCGVR
jgi:hypothetical protein